MSTMISRKAILSFEELEREWLETDNAYDEYWDRKLQDEKLYWEWMENRAQKTVEMFSQLTGLGGQYFTKMMDILREAAMTGFFFGELRWQDDIRNLIESALETPEES